MKILLTGATGFVGQNFYNKYQDNIRCVVRSNEQHAFNDYFEIDGLHSNTEWSGAFDTDVNVVVHLAGLAHNKSFTDEEFTEVNTNGTLQLATEAAKAGINRFVFISSIGVNAVSTFGEPIDEQVQPKPHNFYAESKYQAELGLKQIAAETGLEVVIVRPTLVYGAGAPGNFGNLVKLIKKTNVLPFGCCKNKRSFVSNDNLSDFLYKCAFHPKAAGETFVISDGAPVSTRDFTNAISKGLGKPLIQIPVPLFFMEFAAKLIGKSHQANQLLGDLEVNSSKAEELLDWQPVETMEQAMAKLK